MLSVLLAGTAYWPTHIGKRCDCQMELTDCLIQLLKRPVQSPWDVIVLPQQSIFNKMRLKIQEECVTGQL